VRLDTHSPAVAERLCDRVALFQAGRVAACGRPAELIAAAEAAGGAGYPGRLTLDDAIVALTADRPAMGRLTSVALSTDELTAGEAS
jgi:ABC-2 type transport system ATP-binding protein